jgi:hypothetical protein
MTCSKGKHRADGPTQHTIISFQDLELFQERVISYLALGIAFIEAVFNVLFSENLLLGAGGASILSYSIRGDNVKAPD